MRQRVGVYPGSFNPPTTAHLAVSEAALLQRQLDHVVWAVSRKPLAKEDVDRPLFDDRLAVLGSIAATIDWLSVVVTDAQLLADVADGYDVVIMGADKWHQINELRWYTDEAERQRSLGRLPELAIAPRAPFEVPATDALDVADEHRSTSSTRARAGDDHLMLDEARASSLWRTSP